jgi:hypothetical protein
VMTPVEIMKVLFSSFRHPVTGGVIAFGIFLSAIVLSDTKVSKSVRLKAFYLFAAQASLMCLHFVLLFVQIS